MPHVMIVPHVNLIIFLILIILIKKKVSRGRSWLCHVSN